LCAAADANLHGAAGHFDDEAATQEATTVHEASVGRAGTRLHLKHVHHQADTLGAFTEARSHRATGQDLVPEQKNERQEADAEAGETPSV